MDGGKKSDTGKVPMDLLPAEALLELLPDEGPVIGLIKFAEGGGSSSLVDALHEVGPDIWATLYEASKVLDFGAKKYAAHNWRLGMKWSRLIAAALRHYSAHAQGQEKDPETGLPHLAHFSCCVLFLLAYTLNGTGTDDRYRP